MERCGRAEIAAVRGWRVARPARWLAVSISASVGEDCGRRALAGGQTAIGDTTQRATGSCPGLVRRLSQAAAKPADCPDTVTVRAGGYLLAAELPRGAHTVKLGQERRAVGR